MLPTEETIGRVVELTLFPWAAALTYMPSKVESMLKTTRADSLPSNSVSHTLD